MGPVPDAPSGLALSTTSAVMSLLMLAMGNAPFPPLDAKTPSALGPQVIVGTGDAHRGLACLR